MPDRIFNVLLYIEWRNRATCVKIWTVVCLCVADTNVCVSYVQRDIMAI